VALHEPPDEQQQKQEEEVLAHRKQEEVSLLIRSPNNIMGQYTPETTTLTTRRTSR